MSDPERGWMCTEVDDQLVHIHPIGDLIEHTLDEDCVCGPTLEIQVVEGQPDGHMYTHWPLDKDLEDDEPDEAG